MKPAELSRNLGWNTGVLSQYIKNPDRSPTLSTACKIAIALDVSLDYLSGLIDEPRPIERDEHGNIIVPKLTEDESAILSAYKAVDEGARKRITRTVQGELDDLEDEAKKEARGA